jgi:hypothetical protein
MQRPGDEFPERLEILKLRLVWIVVVRGSLMYTRRQPHGVGAPEALMKRRRSAISSSRPRGEPSPCARPSVKGNLRADGVTRLKYPWPNVRS